MTVSWHCCTPALSRSVAFATASLQQRHTRTGALWREGRRRTQGARLEARGAAAGVDRWPWSNMCAAPPACAHPGAPGSTGCPLGGAAGSHLFSSPVKSRTPPRYSSTVTASGRACRAGMRPPDSTYSLSTCGPCTRSAAQRSLLRARPVCLAARAGRPAGPAGAAAARQQLPRHQAAPAAPRAQQTAGGGGSRARGSARGTHLGLGVLLHGIAVGSSPQAGRRFNQWQHLARCRLRARQLAARALQVTPAAGAGERQRPPAAAAPFQRRMQGCRVTRVCRSRHAPHQARPMLRPQRGRGSKREEPRLGLPHRLAVRALASPDDGVHRLLRQLLHVPALFNYDLRGGLGGALGAAMRRRRAGKGRGVGVGRRQVQGCICKRHRPPCCRHTACSLHAGCPSRLRLCPVPAQRGGTAGVACHARGRAWRAQVAKGQWPPAAPRPQPGVA
jgi:hypothetical protein